jgi:hypothetical protein
VVEEGKKRIPRGEINTKAIRKAGPQFPAVADQEVRSKGRGERSRNGAGGAPHIDRGKGGNGDRPTPTKKMSAGVTTPDSPGRATGKAAPHSNRYMSFAGTPSPKREKPVVVKAAPPIAPTIDEQRRAMAHAQAVRMARYPRQEQRVRRERNNHGNGWAVEKFCPVCGRHWYSGGMCGRCRRAA